MKTYIATVETTTGTQTIQLVATSIQDAYGQVAERGLSAADGLYSYSVSETSPTASPAFLNGMTNASVSLIACLVLFIFLDHLLRKWLKS